jgi:TRAP-type C4-dicarboxylate transport system substrate-binding protein
MNKVRLTFPFVLLVFLALALIFSACAQSAPTPATPTPTPTPTPAPAPTPVQTETYTLRYGGWMPPGTALEAMPEWWAKEVEKRTNGRVKVELYFGEALGKFADMPEILKGGACDIALLPAFRFDSLSLFEVPFVIPNRALALDCFYHLYYRDYLKDLNPYKILWYEPCDPSYLMLRDKKVLSANDFKGMKIRGLSGAWSAFPEYLGATAVTVPTADLYMSLDRGIVDGAITTVELYFIANLQEVIEYCAWEPVAIAGSPVAMNLDLWNSLPADIQVIMEQCNAEARYRFVESIFKTPSEDYASLTESGCEIYELSSQERERWHTIGAQVVDDWTTELEAKGIPGREMLDVIKWVSSLYGGGGR